MKQYIDAEKIILLPSEERCRRSRSCQVLARPLALAGHPQSVVDQVPGKERTIICHPFTQIFYGQMLQRSLGSHSFVHVTTYLVDTQDKSQGEEDFLGHRRFFQNLKTFISSDPMLDGQSFSSRGFPKLNDKVKKTKPEVSCCASYSFCPAEM